MRLLSALFLGFLLLTRASAAEPVELVPGLTYLRITQDAGDAAHLASALAANRPLIIDVRYTPAAEAAQFPLESVLGQRSTDATAPLFILVSPQTPAPLATALHTLPRGAVTLGVDGSRPTPRVVVAQPADVDRRAYDAWSDKIPLASLITGKIEKERYDEAALVKEFRNGGTAPTPATTPVADPAAAKDGEQVPVLTDRVLQRAVHLHRALIALRPRNG